MSLLSISLFAFSAAFPVVGGSDSCASPEVIFGQGTFAFDLTTATTGLEGQGELLCTTVGSAAIENDVWFSWTAPDEGRVRLYTCDQTGVDTKIAVYPGSGCPQNMTALDCNDDKCGTQSTIEWMALAGATYTIQIGNAPGSSAGSGTFQLFLGGNASNNLALSGTATQSATGWGGLPARGIDGNTDGIYNNNSCTHTTDAANSWWEVDLGTTSTISRILLYNRADCCHTRLGNFRVSVFAGATEVFGQDDYMGSGFVPANGVHQVLVPATVAGDRVRVAFHTWNNDGNGSLTLAEVEVISGTPTLSFCHGDGTALQCPCGNGAAAGAGCGNSSGLGGTLTSSGSASLSANDLTFAAQDLVAGQPAVLFQGNVALGNGSGMLFGDGLRCAGSGVRRLGTTVVDASGNASWGPGLAAMGNWSPGSTRRLQVWYGDPFGSPCGTGFNTSNGVELLPLP